MFPSSPVRKLSTARIARVHGDEDLGNFDSCNQGDGDDDDDDDDDDDLAKWLETPNKDTETLELQRENCSFGVAKKKPFAWKKNIRLGGSYSKTWVQRDLAANKLKGLLVLQVGSNWLAFTTQFWSSWEKEAMEFLSKTVKTNEKTKNQN